MDSYCVYEHVFPDGRRYIGLTNNPEKRWKKDGFGYISNRKMFKAIEKFGWDNVKHNIIESGLTRSEAQKREKELIQEYDTIKTGFNTRKGGEAAATLYSKPVMKILQRCKTSIYPVLQGFATDMLELSENEAWAYQVNLVDYVIRTECSAYIDSEDGPLNWCFYISHWASNPSIDIRTINLGEEMQKAYEKTGGAGTPTGK